MAELRITEPHSKGIDDAVAAVQSFGEVLEKYRVKASWSGPNAALKGTGVSGSIAVTEKDVTVTLKLGMLAKAAGIDPERLKGSIQRRLQSALS